MKYGYARVSTDDQNPALQIAALKKAGCEKIFKDDNYQEPPRSALPFSAVSRNSNAATRSRCGSSTD